MLLDGVVGRINLRGMLASSFLLLLGLAAQCTAPQLLEDVFLVLVNFIRSVVDDGLPPIEGAILVFLGLILFCVEMVVSSMGADMPDARKVFDDMPETQGELEGVVADMPHVCLLPWILNATVHC
ncbi:hypothetical protein Droror1_Dr00027000 [Drosera rotundifolia]